MEKVPLLSSPAHWIHYQLSSYEYPWTSYFHSSTPCVTSPCSTACFLSLKNQPSSHRSSKSTTWIPTTSGTIARYQTWPSNPRSSNESLPRCLQTGTLYRDRSPEDLLRHSDAADSAQVTLLELLDLSAAFDTVDHDILLTRLQVSYGVSGSALAMIASFIQHQSQSVNFNDQISARLELRYGVPRRSVLGPLLFILYTSDVI